MANETLNGYSAEQVRAAEAPYLAAGVPLMAIAAAGLADEIKATVGFGRILLLVGSGDNGADTLYAGAELAAGGADVAIICTGTRVHDAALAAALESGAHREDPAEAARLAAASDLVVDGILGTGAGLGPDASPALRGTAREVVAAVLPVLPDRRERPEQRHPLVLAVDIPSGIDPSTGAVPDPLLLPADITVTFGGYKAGLLISPARDFSGRVVLVDIGLLPALERLEPIIRIPAIP
jgi:NAD(P)H-hydrate repair Nnr-like enzyme with NAD(P)H-hydrate epimerase domain